MDAERWQRIQEIFEEALERPAPERDAFLDESCADDPDLRAEVASLLASDEEGGSFIEEAIGTAASTLDEPSDPVEIRGRAGKYEIRGRIGRGGFGIVYEGWDPDLQRRVAIKTCSSADAGLRRRFFREAQIAASLAHPNITTVHDLGIEEGVPFLVQEFLTGRDLDRVIRDGPPLSVERRLAVLTEVARGLEAAHAQGVLHRDVKPGNVRLPEEGGAKLMDFGIARLLNEPSGLTTHGVTLGTVGYLAPEQLKGEPLERQTDVFAFGVMAYELLAGERPFVGANFSEVCYRVLHEAVPGLVERWPECPAALANLVDRCLAKKPEERYADFAALLHDLEPLVPEGAGLAPATRSVALPETVVTERYPTRSRRPRMVVIAAGLAVALAAVTWWAGRAPGGDSLTASMPIPEAAGTELPETAGSTTRTEAREDGRAGDSSTTPPAIVVESPEEGPAVEQSPAAARLEPVEQEGSAPQGPPTSEPAAGVEGAPETQLAGLDPGQGSQGPSIATSPIERPADEPTTSSPGAVQLERESLPPSPTDPVATELPRGGDEPELESWQPGDMLRPGPGVSAPRLVRRPLPEYPRRALRRRLEARVVVMVLVDSQGSVSEARLKPGYRDDSGLGFNEAALEAALGAEFEPATREGQPGKMWTELPFDFRVE